MKTYLLIFDSQAKARWSYTHSSVPVMAESPQEAVRNLMEAADRTNEKVLKVDVYEKLETPSGGWLEASDNICPTDDDDHSDEMQSDMRDYCERYEPTYNPEDGSM